MSKKRTNGHPTNSMSANGIEIDLEIKDDTMPHWQSIILTTGGENKFNYASKEISSNKLWENVECQLTPAGYRLSIPGKNFSMFQLQGKFIKSFNNLKLRAKIQVSPRGQGASPLQLSNQIYTLPAVKRDSGQLTGDGQPLKLDERFEYSEVLFKDEYTQTHVISPNIMVYP